MQIEINETVARKVLTLIDAGLVKGVGNPKPGEMCVEAAVCYALGLPHGDDPQCVAPTLRLLKIRLNDTSWSSNEARAKGLRRLALIQLGSKNNLDEKEFINRLVDYSIRKSTPLALRAVASIIKNEKHKQNLYEAANRCEKEGTRQSTLDAKKIADAAVAAATVATATTADVTAAVATAAVAAAVVAYAADAAVAYAATAAVVAATADVTAAVAYTAAYAADAAVAYAATAAVVAAAVVAAAAVAADVADAKTKRDEALATYAEDVVQILIELKVPGVQWLHLTEA